MAQIPKGLDRLSQRTVGLRIFPELEIDAGQVRQHTCNAPPIVDLTVPDGALMMMAAGGVVLTLRRRDISEPVQRGGDA